MRELGVPGLPSESDAAQVAAVISAISAVLTRMRCEFKAAVSILPWYKFILIILRLWSHALRRPTTAISLVSERRLLVSRACC
jgi:hypothetical protein